MTIPFLTPGLRDSVTRIFQPALRAHTFTWTPVSPAVRTAFGYQPGVPGTPVPNQEGRYLARTRLTTTEAGQVVTATPPTTDDSMLVDGVHPVQTNDLISDIRDRDGVVLLVGPARVAAVLPGAGLGRLTKKRLVLAGEPEEMYG